MVVGSGAGLACGDGGGRPAASSQPRDDEIRSAIDGVWQAIGLDRDRVTVAEYAYTFAPDNTACQALDRDDRWFGERGSSGRVTDRGPADIERAIVDHLDRAGFTVKRYRSTDPRSGQRLTIGTKGELVVDTTSGVDGYTTVDVRSGPCAPTFRKVDAALFEPAT